MSSNSFPPEEWQEWYRHLYEWRAWYSSEPEYLLNYYLQRFQETDKGKFWAQMEREERQEGIHSPLAADIARTSADLLFSELPEYVYDQETEGGQRIKYFMDKNSFNAQILESAELSAALSGVFLKLNIDPDLYDVPILTAITPLQAFPHFTRDILTRVDFWREVKKTDSRTYRLIESRYRENGRAIIAYKLYEGTREKLGKEIALDSLAETEHLGLEPVAYDMSGLGVVYVPNMKPNRLMPGNPMGISDYHGVIGLMDSFDHTYSSLMRDLDLSKAQLIVDEEFLDENQRFSKRDRFYVGLNMSSERLGGSNFDPIRQIQFAFRVDEHIKACEQLCVEIVTRAGYSPQTFGMHISGQAESGTALRIRERKSMLTRQKKGMYFAPKLKELLVQMQEIDKASGLSSGYETQEIDVILNDSIVTDERERSETIRNLEQARAVSTYIKVKSVHPEWKEEDIQAEVDRIMKETGAGIMEEVL